jgi:O-antigen ligase
MGSFESLYSVFQPTSLYLSFDKAHNTYLENALDLGIPISLAIVLAVAAPALRCLRGLRERSRDAHFCAAAVGATVLIALHSTVDFGIQIPAVAVAFSAILGVGWAQSWSSRQLIHGEANRE